MALPTLNVKDADNNIVNINTTPSAGQTVMANSLPVTIASDQSTIEIKYLQMLPTAWTNGSISVDLRLYTTAEIQVANIHSNDFVTVTKSLNNTDFVEVPGIDQNFNPADVITANGLYKVDAGGYLKWAKTGTSSTPTVVVRGFQ